ncbi:M48 family metalloprotease [Lysobacter arenosi]|uniref:M48 family metalloprotease n=1 Tax=Lysobacter arenosi TaxID=2795387 RepID=A0ABX7R9U1_9GAMM|nr:M48 family metalloprotease [Lysobacter arenosi]QSX74903.1 M48 family metalloprotease [Lysobacter arenosi]
MLTQHTRALIAAALCCGAVATSHAAGVDLEKLMGAGAKAGKALTLSDSEVVASANDACAYSDKENKVAPAGDKYAVRLAKIVEGLDNDDGMKLSFKAYLTPDVNAFAMANGCVRVFSGLMDMASDDEIRGVIGHEIGHVKLGHSKAKQRAALLASAARDGAALNGKVGEYAKGQLGDIAESVINAQFSQKEESAADAYGYRFMVRHKYDPNAMVTLFRKMPGAGGLTSSHPASATRTKNIEAMIRKGG